MSNKLLVPKEWRGFKVNELQVSKAVERVTNVLEQAKSSDHSLQPVVTKKSLEKVLKREKNALVRDAALARFEQADPLRTEVVLLKELTTGFSVYDLFNKYDSTSDPRNDYQADGVLEGRELFRVEIDNPTTHVQAPPRDVLALVKLANSFSGDRPYSSEK